MIYGLEARPTKDEMLINLSLFFCTVSGMNHIQDVLSCYTELYGHWLTLRISLGKSFSY